MVTSWPAVDKFIDPSIATSYFRQQSMLLFFFIFYLIIIILCIILICGSYRNILYKQDTNITARNKKLFCNCNRFTSNHIKPEARLKSVRSPIRCTSNLSVNMFLGFKNAIKWLQKKLSYSNIVSSCTDGKKQSYVKMIRGPRALKLPDNALE